MSSSFFFNINPKLKRGKKEKTKKTNKKGNTTPLLLERERDGEERRAARTHFLHAKSVEKESLDDDDRCCSSLAPVGSVGVHRRGRGRWRRRDADGKDSRNRPQDTDDFDDDVAIEDGERKSDVDENEIATDGPRE